MDQGKIHNLNPYHVIGLILNACIGVNLLMLSHSVSKMGYNQWWLPFILGTIASLTLIPMIALCKRYPEDSLFVINEKLLGKWLGRGVNVLVIIYAILNATTVNSGYVRLVQTSMVSSQTVTLPLLGLTLVMVYIANGGIKLVARFCLISFFFTGWMIYYLQWGFQKGGIMHIFPLFNTNFPDVLNALNNSFASMLGFELLLFYYPYIQQKEKALRHALWGVWLIIFFYTLVLLTSVAYFSVWEMEHLIYPILNLFKAVELSFMERLENVGIGVWVFLILSTSAAYIWAARKGMEEMTGRKRKWHLLLPATLSYFIIRGPISTEIQQYLYDKVTVYMGYGVILWPVFLLLVHAIRGKSGGEKT
ncbi:GerAB/ArcD/ProY family transporter [Brevibacillus choshinensis]|uniref:GerAB/ArcD/ProY family transporter n=1 Tax=Brevibacillus choshinensis TaxID=54911 RepID=A0ABX7FKW0_BRECH|nr:GerAB/ArcD/ProY family transporter [Brevibacillus choshinensis]QRG66871.1 GerAB/ArcD/ProY family transporter [Brevibacillus choshinensis]